MTRQATLPAGVGGLALRRPSIPHATTPFTVHQFLGIVRRHLWLIIIITGFFTTTGVVVWYILKKYHPEYTSKAMIRCKMPQQENLLQGVPTMPRKEIITLETNNQAFYLMSEVFLNEILTKRSMIQQTQWYQQRRDDPDQMMKDLKSAFRAAPQRDSELVMVSMRAGLKEEAQQILNEILMQFRQNMYDRAGGELRSKLSALREQRDKVDKEILRKRDQLTALSIKVNVPGWEQDRTITMSEVQMALKEKIILEAQINEVKTQYQRMVENRQKFGLSNMVSSAIRNDPIVMRYKNQISSIQITLDQILDYLGEDHRTVKEIRSSLESVQKELQRRQSNLEQQYSQAEDRSLENVIASLQEQYERMSERYELAATRQSDLDREKANYEAIEREIDELSRNKEQIEQRITEIMIQLDNPDRVRAEIATMADLPIDISFPRLLFFGPVGTLLGLIVSALLIFFMEFMDDTIKIPSDVSRYLHAPLLGMIPFFEKKGDIELEKIAHIQPQAIISEAYRQVRTSLFFSAPASELKTILITSSSAECGKTTTAVNLALTLSAEGKRILLVDANFRRPALNRLFPAEGPPRGLSNILVGQVSAADAIHASGYEGLDIVDTGPTPPNPAVLLNNERMRKFLESHKQYYDHVIIDGPPALLVTDARILSHLADSTIAVVRAGQTSRGIVQRMERELKDNEVNTLGILLNAVKPHKGGYFRKAYRSYYDYIGYEPAPVAALPGPTGQDSSGGSGQEKN